MAEELLINVSEFETRVALLSAGSAQEIHLARADGYSLTGNIYIGRVERVIPGMQAAFVACGLERPGFLHVRDIEGPRLIQGEEADTPPDIRDLLHEGQQLMVQIAKDPIAGKGARQLTFDQGNKEDPSWAPNGRHIIFSHGRGTTYGLRIIDSRTGEASSLPRPRGSWSAPSWSP